MTIFPFTVKAYDNGHFVESPCARKTFKDNRPKDKTWYAFDVTLNSKTDATFTVYGMADCCYGGIGKQDYKFKANMDKSEAEVLILDHIKRMAKEIEITEYNAARCARRKEIEDEIKREI